MTIAESHKVLDLLKHNDYEICIKNVILLGKIAEYFLIDKRISLLPVE